MLGRVKYLNMEVLKCVSASTNKITMNMTIELTTLLGKLNGQENIDMDIADGALLVLDAIDIKLPNALGKVIVKHNTSWSLTQSDIFSEA